MLFVHNLEEKITYTFTVKAQTIGYGTAVSGNVTTGPQAGAPERVSELSLTFTISAVKLSWRNGNSGKSPILGYYIESRRKGRDIIINRLRLIIKLVRFYNEIGIKNIIELSIICF
jgi:protein sidekick